MELDGQAQGLGHLEDPAGFVDREGDALAEGVDRIGELGPGHGGEDLIADEVEVAGAVVLELRRQGMGAEIGGHHVHRAPLGELARHLQHLHLGVAVQPVAGLDLDGGDALGQQRVQPPQGGGGKVGLRFGPGHPHGGGDAAAGLGDLGIGDAGEALLELVGPAAAIDEMGVAVDQAGGGEAALAVGRRHGRRAPRRGGRPRRCGRPRSGWPHPRSGHNRPASWRP